MTQNKLILHIGTHKTGTTTLQSVMGRNREMLAEQGFCYAKTDRGPRPGDQHHLTLQKAILTGEAAMHAERELLLKEFQDSGCHTLVLSIESLSAPMIMNPKVLPLISILTEGFDTRIICVCRRQDYFIESLWNQKSKLMRTRSHIDEFIADPASLRHMNYAKTLDAWSEFGDMTAFEFDQAVKADLIKVFSAATGIELPVEAETRNVSPTMTVAAMLAGLNRLGIEHKWRHVEQVMDTADKRRALGSRLRSDLLAKFAESNAELRRYGIVFSDEMPDEPTEPVAKPPDEEIMQVAAAINGVERRSVGRGKRKMRRAKAGLNKSLASGPLKKT
ncbi:MAG: hypothetical protein H7245_20650 [Candidatus Saccharibacteria bacterium]|nr:hypothetical protein [Pseudorhodobacter sp.]